MKKLTFIVLLLFTGLQLNARDYRVWIFFSDKGEKIGQRLAHPESFLSKESIQKKKNKGIGFTEGDLPVWNQYVETLSQYECKVLGKSRWLNAVAVQVPENCLEEVNELCFVTGSKALVTLSVSRETSEETAETMAKYVEMTSTHEEGDAFEYGEGRFQAEMLQVTEMHKKGITGKGVKVAVFDAGFDAVDTIDVFDSLWVQKRITTWWDFVDNDNEVFDSDSHGTNVLSTIAANLPGEMVGIAPHASFILARTEQSRSETNREEYNWVRAMEWADSIGVDIIHSSLGYSKFDDGVGSYTYDDMNGNTAISSKAADEAAKRGIIVTISAGNEGGDAWKYITAPSDADSVLCVGAVGRNGKRAYFSSIGPSSDGQVKPDVMALGKSTTVANPSNEISVSDGTSFSGPIMAGFMILLKQSNKNRINMDLIQATRLSADQYNFPDPEYGYGIPNILVADSILKNVKNLSTVVMPGAEKPTRGEQPKKATEIIFSNSPKSTLRMDGNNLLLTATSPIKKVEVRQDNKRVYLPAKSVTITGNLVKINLKSLMSGEHYLHIETEKYEENIKFKK